jgi:hypothetical protein
MTIKVLTNTPKADFDKLLNELNKNKKTFNPKDYIGKFPFQGDSLAFQKDLR